MKKRIIIEAGKPERIVPAGFDLLALLAASYGLLLLVQAVDGVRIDLRIAVPLVSVPGISLWLLRRMKRRYWFWIGFLAEASAAVMLFLRTPRLRAELLSLWNSILRAGEGAAVDVTWGAVLITSAGALVISLLELAVRVHWPLFLLITVLLLSAPLLGINPGIGTVLLFFVFLMGFWMLNGTVRGRSGRGLRHGRQRRIGRRAIAASSGLLAAVFAAAVLMAGWNSDWFYQTVYETEGQLHRTIQRVSGTTSTPDHRTVSRGNLYPSGIEELEIRTDQEPTETLYLRGFSGGAYQNGEWQPANDSDFFAAMNENSLHWDRWASWIPNMYSSMYFVLNSSIWREEPIQARVLHIYQNPSAGETPYAPYFSIQNRRQIREFASRENEYSYLYYEWQEMDFDWGGVESNFYINWDWYRELEDAFLREATGPYTQVPVEDLPRLVQLCADNPADSLEEITAFIVSALQENAVYTRTPGLFPMTEDPVEYFLFEKQEGYCQHFAAAAVMMYRLYGIPARYAAGYAVSPSDFIRQPDGSYFAVVTDENAHAWPEIYLDNYGWTPIEVTPSADRSLPAYPGMDQTIFEELMASGNWNMEQLEQERVQGDRADTSSAAFRGFRLPAVDPESVLLVLLYALLLASGAYLIWRGSTLRSMEKMDVRRSFSRILDAVHTAGLLKEYDGSEPDFAAALAGAVPGLGEDQAQSLMRLAETAAFGDTSVPPEQEKEMRDLYRQIALSLYRKLPRRKKLAFQYLHHFL